MSAAAQNPAAHAPPRAAVVDLGDYWPGIQMYYPPVKYAPSLGIYEDLEQAALRFRKHAWRTAAHTLLFDRSQSLRSSCLAVSSEGPSRCDCL